MAVGEGIEGRGILARRVKVVHHAEAVDTGKFNSVASSMAAPATTGSAPLVASSPVAAVETHAQAQGRMLNRILLVALVLGGSVDVLFYKKATGISALVFIGLIIGSLVTLGVMESVKVAWRNVWLAAPLVFFAAMVAVRANPEITLMNLGAALSLLIETRLPLLFCCDGQRVPEDMHVLRGPKLVAKARQLAEQFQDSVDEWQLAQELSIQASIQASALASTPAKQAGPAKRGSAHAGR